MNPSRKTVGWSSPLISSHPPMNIFHNLSLVDIHSQRAEGSISGAFIIERKVLEILSLQCVSHKRPFTISSGCCFLRDLCQVLLSYRYPRECNRYRGRVQGPGSGGETGNFGLRIIEKVGKLVYQIQSSIGREMAARQIISSSHGATTL